MKELTTSNAISMSSESAHCGDMPLKTPKDYRVITAAHALLNASMIAYWGGDRPAVQAVCAALLDRFLCIANTAGYTGEDILRTLLSNPETCQRRVLAELERAAHALGEDAFHNSVYAVAKSVGFELPEPPSPYPSQIS